VNDRIEIEGIKVVKKLRSECCSIEVDNEKDKKIALINLIVNAVEAIDEKEGLKLSTSIEILVN
jgi:signal transduction histidine kinase